MLEELLAVDLTGLKGGLNYIEARTELIRTFNSDYGIDAGPTGVEMSSNENMTKGSLLEYWAEKYAQYKVWDIWHISLDEYTDRPSFMIEALNQTADRINKQDLAALERLKNSLNK